MYCFMLKRSPKLTRMNFSAKYQYNISQENEENKEKILQTNNNKNYVADSRGIANKILGEKGCRVSKHVLKANWYSTLLLLVTSGSEKVYT